MTFWDEGNSSFNDVLEEFKKMIITNKKDNYKEYEKRSCSCC